jgi:hypothetical protein
MMGFQWRRQKDRLGDTSPKKGDLPKNIRGILMCRDFLNFGSRGGTHKGSPFPTPLGHGQGMGVAYLVYDHRVVKALDFPFIGSSSNPGSNQKFLILHEISCI